jgi:hypothetical protein
MKVQVVCPACGAEIEGDLAPGEAFACPGCGASCVAPVGASTPPPLPAEEWPAPFVGPPAFSPAVRAALLRALRAERESGSVPEAASAFVSSCYSEQRLVDIHKRAQAGHDLSELDDLYREHFAPIFAAAVDERAKAVRSKRRLREAIYLAIGAWMLVRICGCIIRGTST